ncbi:MAG: DnaJ domain-containing protein [Micrococcales bacterium]|nr:DnaJ domain-containing protein [Micrococcales bacterium]
MNDYYETLGVNRGASAEEIKRAYRRQSVRLHPDVAGEAGAGEEAEEQMKALNQAYQVLSDPDKRAQYDMGVDPFATPGSSGAQGFGGFGDFLDAMFSAAAGSMGPQGPTSRRRRGRDLVDVLSIDLAEAVFGTTRDATISTFARCDSCEGAGTAPGTQMARCGACGGRGVTTRIVRSLLGEIATQGTCPTCQGFGSTIPNPCPACTGAGRVRSRVTVPVDVAAGVATGDRIRVPGQGEAGPGGGPSGDLYFDVRVRNHPDFTRDGDHLHCTVQVPMTAAALGARLTLTTLDGVQEIDVPPGAQPASVVIVPGLGVGRLRRKGRGDLHVHLDVQVPDADDDEQRDLLRRLAELRGETLPEAQLATSGRGVFTRIKDKLAGP